jgi:hypothetical protein
VSQFLGFGNGSDGVLSIGSDTTDAPIDSACTGTGNTTTLSATNASFAVNQIILIHQSAGTSGGSWELNQIADYVAGTITTTWPLVNTYSSGAQVLVMKQYSGITVNGSSTLLAKLWDGNAGGIIAYLCSGKCSIIGAMSANARGSRGGATEVSTGNQSTLPVRAYCGDGNTQLTTRDDDTGGTGGGGGGNNKGGGYGDGGSPGGGGGNGTVGTIGVKKGATAGAAGLTGGSVDLTSMCMGGGGGAGGCDWPVNNYGGAGGVGGGIILIFAREFVLTCLMTSNGGNGANGTGPNDNFGGGGGAGGSIFIKGERVTLGTNCFTLNGGLGGSGWSGYFAGNGGLGRIRAEGCILTGSNSTPSTSISVGGYDFCGSIAEII